MARVTSERHTKTRTIMPEPAEEISDVIGRLLSTAKIKRTDGRITLNLKQGGVRNVETEDFEEVEQKLTLHR